MTAARHASEYLTWAKRRTPARYNLARSGVPRLAIERLSLTLSDITAIDAYEDGWEPFMEMIAARYGVTPGHVVTASGCSLANHLVFAALVEAGDDVAIETPVYEPLVRLAAYFGARVVSFTRREENAWRVDPADVRRALTPRTRLVVLSNLNNPTGAHDTQETMAEIARAAGEAGAHVLVDEVYLEFVHASGERTAALRSDAIVTTRSMTKAFGLDALRSGWIVAHPELAGRIRRLNDLFAVNMAQPSERIALRALERADGLLAEANALLHRNIERVDAFVRSRESLSWVKPRDGTVGLVRTREEDTTALAERLHRDFGVAVVPGRFFGVPGYVRIGWGLDTEELEAALAYLARAIA